ncbi:MAG: DUF1674 domain-containing protein [Methylococcaceae bacterium]
MKQSEKLDFQKQPSNNPEDNKGEPQLSSNKDTSEVTVIPPDPTRYGDWEKNGRCIDF